MRSPFSLISFWCAAHSLRLRRSEAAVQGRKASSYPRKRTKTEAGTYREKNESAYGLNAKLLCLIGPLPCFATQDPVGSCSLVLGQKRRVTPGDQTNCFIRPLKARYPSDAARCPCHPSESQRVTGKAYASSCNCPQLGRVWLVHKVPETCAPRTVFQTPFQTTTYPLKHLPDNTKLRPLIWTRDTRAASCDPQSTGSTCCCNYSNSKRNPYFSRTIL